MTLEQKIQHRNQVITRTGTVGIIANVGLALAKAVIGLIANSLPIVLDAVNSATDALSSIVTIIGVKLAGKPADKEHPMGYGRVEYLSALLVATAVFATGIITMRDSILKVIHPELAHYDLVAVIVIVLSIAMKIWLGLYTRKRGKETQSEALDASGIDALFDAVVTSHLGGHVHHHDLAHHVGRMDLSVHLGCGHQIRLGYVGKYHQRDPGRAYRPHAGQGSAPGGGVLQACHWRP